MDATLLLPIVVFAAVLAVAYGVPAVLGRENATVRRRLEGHAVSIAVAEAKRRERVKVLKEDSYSPVPVVNALLRRFRPARTALGELLRADLGVSVAQYLALRLLVAALAAAGVYVATANPLLAGVGLPLGLMAPRLLVRFRGRRRRLAFEAQLAEAIDLLVGGLRAGHGFLQGIESVARETEDPMKKELTRIIEQVNVGVEPIDALQHLTERIASYDLALFAAAIAVQRQAGGNLAEVLENLAHTVRERRRIRGEVRALTTAPRVSSYVLGLVPIGLLLYFITVSARYREVMFETSFGQMMLVAATVWSAIGLLVSQKLAKVEY